MTTLVIPTNVDMLAVMGPPQGQWKATDWESLPDDGNRYEIIDGVLYRSTAPSNFHQWIIFLLVELIGIPAKKQNLAYSYFAPIGVFMPGCDPVQPDFIVILKENAHIVHDRRIYGVPDFIAEVLSPGNRDYDEEVKKAAYEKAGVPEYAVVDASARQLRLYSLINDKYDQPHIFNENDVLTLACLPEITLTIHDLFDDAPDTTL